MVVIHILLTQFSHLIDLVYNNYSSSTARKLHGLCEKKTVLDISVHCCWRELCDTFQHIYYLLKKLLGSEY